eukprot:Phypoly_transcript_06681.p1 GENE.Phypoly_transcript_06681~~Phypoly_transcript_06681.p1  ORF type:complete len:216 (+),score=16.87 Phypoly_transcript_06681:1055-1702(+)
MHGRTSQLPSTPSYALHRFALLPRHHHISLSRGTRAALIKAHLLSCHPWTPNDLTISFPPPNTPLFFCDGSIAHYSASCVYLSSYGSPLYLRWIVPPIYCTSQQLIELYTLVRSYQFASGLHSSFCLVSDSSSSIFSASSLTSGAHQPMRAKLLRLLSNSLTKSSAPTHLLWVPSEHNPADYPSRYLPFTNHPTPFHPPLPPINFTLHFSSLPPQ